MLTKKINYSLYISLLLQMTFSTLISISLFVSLVGLDHYFHLNGAITLWESIKAEIMSETHHIYAGIFCIILFFTMSIGIISKLVSYIKIIEAGIKKLSDDNMIYSIPVIGTDELARLAQSVNEIKEELRQKIHKERAHELHRKMLITNISHDLRTPLTSVIGYLDLAKNTVPPEDEIYSYLETAEKNSLRLKKLISDLFLYSKIISEDIEMDLQKINLKTLLNQITELKTYPVKIINKLEEPHLFINVVNFHRIMDNLLENAHKYGISARKTIINVHQNEDKIIIDVKNFTEENLSSKINFLTQRLYTADKNRNESSSGLGLSIVSELTKRMQGELNIIFDEQEKTFIARLSFAKIQTK